MKRRRGAQPDFSFYWTTAAKTFFGILWGFIVVLILQSLYIDGKNCANNYAEYGVYSRRELEKEKKIRETKPPNITKIHLDKPPQGQNAIFIGVMTAEKYLDTRAVAAYQTWVKTIPGEVVFFSREGSMSKYDIPVVALPGVTDDYPPQKKAFMMLKYMHDHYIDKYKWFVRADDDVHIRGEKLMKFLNSVNNTVARYIGNAGSGLTEHVQSTMGKYDNYCIGGPGMILSQSTLRKIAPHIQYCLKNLYTTHEDVEVGRCIYKFAEVQCTWAYEMKKLFYQGYDENKKMSTKVYAQDLKTSDIHGALTLHPIKDPPYQYRLYNHLLTKRTEKLHLDILQKLREKNRMETLLELNQNVPVPAYLLPLSLTKFVPSHRDDVQYWDFLKGTLLYQNSDLYQRSGQRNTLKSALNRNVIYAMDILNKHSLRNEKALEYKSTLYGYKRVSPFGADYVLDLSVASKPHKDNSINVARKHVYLHQTFYNLEFREEGESLEETISTAKQRPLSMISDDATSNKMVHFILPLAGRYDSFLRFTKTFEDICLKSNGKVSLSVVLFKESENDTSNNIERTIQSLQSMYPNHDLRLVHMDGDFSRGKALEKGASLYDQHELLFFVDVDVVFNDEFIQRIKINTKENKQVYFPMMFSHFDPDIICDYITCPDSPFVITPDNGYWRRFSFGMLSLYKSDFDSIGGFDTTIQGWGKEDLDIMNKLTKSNLTIIRAADPGLIHIFHQINCDPDLEEEQYRMCLGTKGATYAPTRILSEIIYKHEDILYKTISQGHDEIEENEESQKEEQVFEVIKKDIRK